MSRAPIAIVSIVDDDRIWFKSHHGLDIAQIGRDPGLCASCVQQDGPWIVNDARTDPRALANPLIAGELGAQFLPLTRIGRGVTLDHLAARQLEPFVGEQATRVELEGPLLLSPMAAQNIGLALHELATNAVKYGAFSESRGKVRVIWHHAPPRLVVEWRERDGPPAKAPVQHRFGHAVLFHLVPEALDGEAELAFNPEGFSWKLDIPTTHVL